MFVVLASTQQWPSRQRSDVLLLHPLLSEIGKGVLVTLDVNRQRLQ